MSARTAPRQQVVEVIRRSRPTEYIHVLSCDHRVRRKRRAPSKVIGCEQCELSQYPDENSIERLRFKLADTLGIDPSDVSLNISGAGELRGAYCRFPAALVMKFISKPLTRRHNSATMKS